MRTKIYYSTKGSFVTSLRVISVLMWSVSIIFIIVGIIKIFNNTGWYGDDTEIMVGIGLITSSILLTIQAFVIECLRNIMKYIMLRKGEMFREHDFEEINSEYGGSGDWEDVKRMAENQDNL